MGEQLSEAGILMAVGMTVVFAFLTLLIGGIKAISAFCSVFPSVDEQLATPTQNQNYNSYPNSSPTTTVSPQIKAAIQTAVNIHRQN